jgi:hypothetical protein
MVISVGPGNSIADHCACGRTYGSAHNATGDSSAHQTRFIRHRGCSHCSSRKHSDKRQNFISHNKLLKNIGPCR